MSEPGIRVLVGCQNYECATETSYHLDMVKMWRDEPICEDCYIDETCGEEETPDWSDLPPVTMVDLCA